ncbi:hypothetical protein N431DRAFT_463849 [Stipitochalara longipes BDJ]|nr:hypothetical protein N431DRAFT_463849 [Stipitochalara longipes BDJ]
METPKQSHVTPLITMENFQAGHLKPLSYSTEDICTAIINHLNRTKEEMGKTQLKSLERFQYNIGIATTDPDSPEELKKWFDILNAMVFNNILSGYCEIEFFPRTRSERSWVGCGCYSRPCFPGDNLDSRFRSEKLKIHIGIRKTVTHFFKSKSYTRRAYYYRSDLIHAMLHAAFQLYACRCDNGCGEKLAESYSRYGGHDMLWLAAAHAIEQADKVIVEGDNQKGDTKGVYLELHLNAARSLVRCWDYIPPDIELRQVGLDIKAVRDELADWRETNPSNHEAEQRARHLMKANRCLKEDWIVDRKEDCELCESVQATMRA